MLKYNNINDINFIIDNLRDEDLEEVKAIWPDNWKENIVKSSLKHDFMTLLGTDGKGNEIPIAVGGFTELFEKDSKIACVWLLCSKYIKYNKKKLLKEIKKQLDVASVKYQIMYNYIYKSNSDAKRWIKKMGFCFNNPKPDCLCVAEDFEFFYKLNW